MSVFASLIVISVVYLIDVPAGIILFEGWMLAIGTATIWQLLVQKHKWLHESLWKLIPATAVPSGMVLANVLVFKLPNRHLYSLQTLFLLIVAFFAVQYAEKQAAKSEEEEKAERFLQGLPEEMIADK